MNGNEFTQRNPVDGWTIDMEAHPYRAQFYAYARQVCGGSPDGAADWQLVAESLFADISRHMLATR